MIIAFPEAVVRRPFVLCMDLDNSVLREASIDARSQQQLKRVEQFALSAELRGWPVLHTVRGKSPVLAEGEVTLAAPLRRDIVVRRRASAFLEPAVNERIARLEPTSIFVIGAGFTCLGLATALAGFELGYPIAFVLDANLEPAGLRDGDLYGLATEVLGSLARIVTASVAFEG